MMWLVMIMSACHGRDPCASMCSTATQHYGGCDWGLGMGRDAGYSNENASFTPVRRGANRQLEVEAGYAGATTAECEQWEALIEDPEFSCQDWGDLTWNDLPW